MLATSNHQSHLGELILAGLLVLAVLGVASLNVSVEDLVESFGPSVLRTLFAFGSPAVSSIALSRRGGHCEFHVELRLGMKFKRVELASANGLTLGFFKM